MGVLQKQQRSVTLTADFDKLCRETAQIACGKDARICVGYLKGYSGKEFHQAVADRRAIKAVSIKGYGFSYKFFLWNIPESKVVPDN